MKKSFSRLLTSILCIIMFFSIIGCNNSKNENKATKSPDVFPITDDESSEDYAKHFRIIKDLNVAGSGQFTPAQLKNATDKIGSDLSITVVDLRLEPHGFINSSPLSFYKKDGKINSGLTTEETISEETNKLAQLNNENTLTLYDKNGNEVGTKDIERVYSEQTLCNELKLKYMRFATEYEEVPSTKTVDDFVSFILNEPKNSFLYIHDFNGEARTTTFMAMFDIMKNYKSTSFESIIEKHFKKSGFDLKSDTKTYNFLEGFYKYCTESTDLLKISYSTWIKSKNS